MAYGVNAPFGLRPSCSIDGGSWTEKTNEYEIFADDDGVVTYQNAIFAGDPVVWNTSISGTAANGLMGTIGVYNPNYVDGAGGNPSATFAGTGAAPIVGVFVSCEYESNMTSVNNVISSPYWPGGAQVRAGTKIKAYVTDDPTVVYDVQVSTNINANANAFVAYPSFPVLNNSGGAPFNLSGSFGRNFALMVGGGTNFNTVTIGGVNAGYANNPQTGDRLSGQSAFYLCSSTTTAAGITHDYNKTVTTLPLRALSYTRNPQNIARRNPIEVNLPPTIGLTPFTNVQVTINNHAWAPGSAATVYVA